MKNQNIMDKAIGLLRGHYFGNIIVLVVIFLLIVSGLIPFFTDGLLINTTVERYAIMITIIVIPASLKYFAHRLKKLPRPMGTGEATAKYKSAFFLRLYPISTVTLMHIVLFGFSRNMNFFWFTIVLFIIFFFCKPSYEELENLTKDEQEATGE